MGIIPKVRNVIRRKKNENVWKCHVKSLKRMDSVLCVKTRLHVLYVNLKTKQSNLLGTTFLQNFEKGVSLCSDVALQCLKALSNGWIIATNYNKLNN